MSHVVIITDPARDQLLKNAVWWSANRSGEQAVRWYDGFISFLETLSNAPDKHRLARENHLFEDELRECYYGLSRRTHRAVYRIDGNVVRVLAIRHLAQDDMGPEDIE